MEDVLVENPDMLMPNLTLVGRQTPTAGGYLDLLGVNKEGQLVVFELKRSNLTRDAVVQVIDYCSALEEMSNEELAEHIAERSGHSGISVVEDLNDWYSTQYGKNTLDSLRPIRMALVGLGADESATRMVDYLRGRGVDISLLTFYGYEHEGATLLARHAEERLASDSSVQVKGRNLSPNEQRESLDRYAASLGIADLWDDAASVLHTSAADWSVTTRYKGLTFYMPRLEMEELESARGAHGSHSVRLDSDGKIRVTFFPAAIELCHKEFMEQRQNIPFQTERARNAPTTRRVQEEWYCLLDEEEWEEHKTALEGLAEAVNGAWLERLQA